MNLQPDPLAALRSDLQKAKSQTTQATQTDAEKLAIAIKALKAIANCPEADPARYVAAVDIIAIDALIALDQTP